MFNIVEFLGELIHVLIVDELSERVRKQIHISRQRRRCRRVMNHVHIRNRERLINKIRTVLEEDP